MPQNFQMFHPSKMQVPTDSSWIVDFQTASGTRLILWEEILKMAKDEVIKNDFSGVFLWEDSQLALKLRAIAFLEPPGQKGWWW